MQLSSKLFLAILLCSPSSALACTRTVFDDGALREWTDKNPKGMILVVSDGMPYSEMSIADVEQESKKRKLPLLILSDREGKKQKERCDSILTSSALIQKGALRHFPSLFFVKSHAIVPQVIPGIQTKAELQSNLNDIFR